MVGKRCIRCSNCLYFEYAGEYNQETEEVDREITCSAGNTEHIGWDKDPCDKFQLDLIFQ